MAPGEWLVATFPRERRRSTPCQLWESATDIAKVNCFNKSEALALAGCVMWTDLNNELA